MNKAPSFQFYAQDFLTGVMYLTNEEIGIYIKMLAKQWTDGKIPKKRLGFLVGLEWDKFSEELQSKVEEKEGYLINVRLEEEREKKKSFLKKQSENGKKGGRPSKEGGKTTVVKNPNESQKKPLEDEDEKEEEEEVRKGKKKKEKKGDLIFPFDDESFKVQWRHWKIFKDEEFKFKYKSIQSEQAALNQLGKLSKTNKDTAIEIIHQSMSNGWKGFFEVKQSKQNGFEADSRYFKEVHNSQAAKDFTFS